METHEVPEDTKSLSVNRNTIGYRLDKMFVLTTEDESSVSSSDSIRPVVFWKQVSFFRCEMSQSDRSPGSSDLHKYFLKLWLLQKMCDATFILLLLVLLVLLILCPEAWTYEAPEVKQDVFATTACPAFLTFTNAAYLAGVTLELPCRCKPQQVTAPTWSCFHICVCVDDGWRRSRLSFRVSSGVICCSLQSQLIITQCECYVLRLVQMSTLDVSAVKFRRRFYFKYLVCSHEHVWKSSHGVFKKSSRGVRCTDVESQSQTELSGSAAFSPVTYDTCQKQISVQLTENTSAPLFFV